MALQATLTFRRDGLLYDISNYGYIEGHILPEQTEHSRHTIKDVCEDGNVDRVTRLLNLYHAMAVELLYAYTKRPVATADTQQPWNDELETPETYVITLELPDDFSQTTVTMLEHWVHEYLVCHVLADWLSITNTAKAEIWMSKAQEAEVEIGRAVSHRHGTLRRKLRPF